MIQKSEIKKRSNDACTKQNKVQRRDKFYLLNRSLRKRKLTEEVDASQNSNV